MLLGLALKSGVGTKTGHTLSKMVALERRQRTLVFLMMNETGFFNLQEEETRPKKEKRLVRVTPFLLRRDRGQFTSGDLSWTTVASADAPLLVVGVVCFGLPGSFPPSTTVHVSLFCGVTSVLLVVFFVFIGRPRFFFLATPTPEFEATAGAGTVGRSLHWI